MVTPYPTKNRPSELTLRLGGSVGRHAREAGIFFNPLPWALLAATVGWIVLMTRQVPCLQTAADQPVNSFLRLCYSDIPVLYQARGLALGNDIFVEHPMEYPVLIVVFIAVMRWVTSLLGGVVGADATLQQQVESANLFFLVNAVALFLCFLVVVLTQIAMVCQTSILPNRVLRVRGFNLRSWDALLVAASPLVVAAGLINWDLLAMALTGVGLLFWARKRTFSSGVLVGLAFAAKFYPAVLVAALFLLCLRAGQMKAFWRFFAGGLIAWLAVNVPYLSISFTGWKYFWTFNADRGADLGSIWYVFKLAGFSVPYVSAVALACMALGGAGIVWLGLRAPARPRLAQLALLVLIVFLVFNKVYSPQYMLWLLPFVVLARPKVFDVAVFTISELSYFCAIWGFLEGIMGPGSGADLLYWVAVFLRVGVQVWLGWRVVVDVRCPWQDSVRLGYVDDPIGGVLDHSSDAAWMLRTSSISSQSKAQDEPIIGARRAALPSEAEEFANPSGADLVDAKLLLTQDGDLE